MKESLVCLLVLVLFATSYARDTKLLIDLQEHGITAPRYTDNSAYKTTSNNYEEQPGELTDPGILQMENIGKQLRSEYIESKNFLPNEFKPQNFYLKAYRDEPSIISSYATILGAYPDSAGWIQYQHMGGFSEPPFDREDEVKVRQTLGVTDQPSQLSTREATIWSERAGRTLFNDPVANCPQMQKQMSTNLDNANRKFTENKRFDALYEQMSKNFGIPESHLNFKNAHLYLDDYVTSKANGKSVPQFEEQVVADQWMQSYYRKYYYEGLYGENNDLARVSSNHFFTYLLTAMYGKYKTAKGELSSDHYENLKYSQFVGNENAMTAAIKLMNDKNSDPVLPPQFGSTLRYELFEQNGQYFVKGTIDGKIANLEGDLDGVMPYDEFMNMIYKKLYFGDVDKFCAGQESAHGRDKPTFSNYEEYIWSVNPELRTSYKLSESKENSFVEQSFVEVKQQPEAKPQVQAKAEPEVVNVVEPIVVSAPPQQVQQRVVSQNYQPQRVPTQRYGYSSSASAVREEPRRQYSQVRTQPTIQTQIQNSPQRYATRAPSATQVSVSQPTQNVEFASMVETAKCGLGDKNQKNKFSGKYDPLRTNEYDVDIPYLHPVDVQQVQHDTRVVMVPQPVIQEKVVKVPQRVVEERIVKEKPTEMHHIKLQKESAPLQFLETAEAPAATWPWWWWLPLLLLCCCLPLCCLALWYLCCRKQPERPKPAPRPIQKAAPIREKPKPQPREETEVAQHQEKQIEDEIQAELRKSRARRTEAAQEKRERPVVYHHSRYIEKPRLVEEQNIGVYDRTATYDAINRGTNKYQHIDDSYYVQQQPERVERVVETVYNPPVTETNERRVLRKSQSRKSFVNPNYLADDVVYETTRKSGEGYVSREAPRRTVKEVVTYENVGSPRVQTSGRAQHRYASGERVGEAVDHVYTSGRVVRDEIPENRRSGREIEQHFFQEGTDGRGGNVREEIITETRTRGGGGALARSGSGGAMARAGSGYREEVKIREETSPKSYSSNQQLHMASKGRSGKGTVAMGSKAKSGGLAMSSKVSRQRATAGKQDFLDSDSEDDY